MKRPVAPALPIERFNPGVVALSAMYGPSLEAQRNPSQYGDLPDSLIISTHSSQGSFSTYLTPAMLVHIANTLLTDTERAAIQQHPIVIALDASVREDLITPEDRSAILSTIAGGHTE